MKTYNIVLCGVGGQGTILASKVIAQTAVRSGQNCRVGETHGMSQRGGSVISHVRIGDRIYGALTPDAQGDLMIAFEPVESLRYMNYLKKDAYIILNNQPIIPTSVNAGLASYPAYQDILKELQVISKNIEDVEATKIAESIGGVLFLNMVVLGTAAKVPGFPYTELEIKKSIEELVKPKFIDINLKAFEAGIAAFK
jgi:indolepyruvate ferredoxin oxidoreductase, beta subunit